MPPHAPHPPLFTEAVSVDWTVADLDIDTVRRTFAPLFDRAAHAVQLAGYEQDDALIDRSLTCRTNGIGDVQIPADSLGDVRRLRRDIRRAVDAAAGREIPASAVKLVALTVKATLAQGPIFPALPNRAGDVP